MVREQEMGTSDGPKRMLILKDNLKIIFLREKEPSTMKMVLITKVNSQKIRERVLVRVSGQMTHGILAIG